MKTLFVCLMALLVVGCKSSTSQSVFSSPGAAVDSLVGALRANDEARLEKIFGQDGVDILFSGDAVADQNDRQRFLQAYDTKHEIQTLSPENKQVTLVIGAQDWPFPVPIVKVDKGWMFDTDAGIDEILNRRIGRNELDTIQVCLAIADAQREYAQLDPEKTGLPVYAQKIVSDPGRKNGLYWPTGESETQSPLGPLVAQAADEGYGGAATRPSDGESAPYHGYRYRLLTAQGPSAAGGAAEYLINGKLIGGFALIAYPADYGNSGIMTFIVNQDGKVHQKDLGDDTQKAARAITAYDPGEGWKEVSPEDAKPGE
jgi:hypothetical protein